MKYLHIFLFLVTHDLTELKEFWRVEFIETEKPFKWRRLFRALRKRTNKFMFWYRLAYLMKRTNSEVQKHYAYRLNDELKIKYTIEISLDADIDIGLTIYHHCNVFISPFASIGKNCVLHQNVTIGQKEKFLGANDVRIFIGDNVYIGTNSVILGGKIKIGNDVSIGAMSFINKNIPDNCAAFTEKELSITFKN